MSLFNKTLAFIAISIALFSIGGCASKPKLSAQERADISENLLRPMGVIYAQVNKANPVKDRRNCDDPNYDWDKQSKAAFCSQPVQIVWVALNVSKGQGHSLIEAVPVDVALKPGSIIKLDMNKPHKQHFVSVAAFEETDTCHWEGHGNEALWNGAKKFAVYTAGFASTVVAPVTLIGGQVYTKTVSGGVVCEGWSHEEGFKSVDWDAITAKR